MFLFGRIQLADKRLIVRIPTLAGRTSRCSQNDLKGCAIANIAISPADMAGKGNGNGDSYRIYSKAHKVKLEVQGKQPCVISQTEVLAVKGKFLQHLRRL